MTKPLARDGALVGAMLTTAFLAVSFLGWTALSLPFLPYDLFDWIARGLLKVRIGGTYPLAEASRAHADMESRTTTGKLLLIP